MLVDRRACRSRDKLLADIPAEIGLDQQHLELFVEVFVERAAIEKLGDLAENAAPGLLQTLTQLLISFSLSSEETAENHCAMPLLNVKSGLRVGM